MFWRKNKPFTREKGLRLLQKAKSPDQLDLNRRNTEAQLSEADLSGADLSSATLMDVDSYDHWYCVRFDGAKLRGAKVDLSYIDKAGLSLYV
jgi:uncharacterized protein YjbI with pentapeptide repeats